MFREIKLMEIAERMTLSSGSASAEDAVSNYRKLRAAIDGDSGTTLPGLVESFEPISLSVEVEEVAPLVKKLVEQLAPVSDLLTDEPYVKVHLPQGVTMTFNLNLSQPS